MEVFNINSSYNNIKLYCRKWLPDSKPKAILQIIHGMNEYIDRYEAFAQWLSERGIIVVGDDHIGHGHSASSSRDRGYFGSEKSVEKLISDEDSLRRLMEKEYPGLPYIMLGHSFGSFIMRAYLSSMDCSDLAGSIIMGTAGTNPLLGFGSSTAKLLRRLYGERHRSKLITVLVFGSY